LVQQEGVLNTTVTLTGSSQVALARNPRPRSNTAVARGRVLPQTEQQQYGAVGEPVVITPQAGPNDGYIYPADGSSSEARYPAPRGSRTYDAGGYGPGPQQDYYYQPRPYYQPPGLFTYQR
jgi:hypothetical protein